MLTITKPFTDRVNIDLNGKLDAEEMAKGLDALIAFSEGISKGHILYRISDFELPTLGAIGVEMSRLPKLFALLGKFEKCAVLSDSAWLRKAAVIEGALFPGIEIKSFKLQDSEEAEIWLKARSSLRSV